MQTTTNNHSHRCLDFTEFSDEEVCRFVNQELRFSQTGVRSEQERNDARDHAQDGLDELERRDNQS